MIIVMKKIILIPILLSTFFLVGCESELDRCIEANGGNIVFDGVKFKEKMDKFATQYGREFARLQGEDSERLEQMIEEYELSLDPIETEVNACFEEKYMKESDKILESTNDLSEATKLMNKVDQEAIINSCKKQLKTKAKAKKICNAQGVY